MAGINIPLLANVRDFLRGLRDGGKGVEDLADDLTDLARDAERSGSKAGDALSDVADESRDAARKIERDFKDAFESVNDGAKRAGDDASDGLRRASEGAEEFKDEANSTAREAAASFDGSAESIADAFQEVAANAFAGFGPAGAAAGLAAAAGIGILLNSLNEAAEKANDLTEEAGALALEWGKASDAERVQILATRWEEVATALADVRSIWEVWQPRAITNAERFAESIDAGAVSADSLTAAFSALDPADRLRAASDAIAEIDRSAQRLDDALLAVGTGEFVDGLGEAEQALADSATATQQTRDALSDYRDEAQAAVDIEEALARASGQTVEAYRESTAAAERASEAQSAYASALEDTADPVSTYASILADKEAAERAAAESTAAATQDAADSWEDYAGAVKVTTDDLINEWNRQAAEAEAFEANLAEIAAAGGQALADELRAKGPEVAGSVAAVIAEADPAKQREAINAHAAATGAAMGSSVAGGIRDSAGEVQNAVNFLGENVRPGSIRIPVEADLEPVRRQIADYRPVIVGTVRAGQIVQ